MSRLASVLCRALDGITSPEVMVEVHVANGLPAFTIVGLPEISVRESRDRVRAALINSGFEFPARKIIVNLAPAELPKSGGRFDLPIAIGILIATSQLDASVIENRVLIGELGLSGELRSVAGCLPSALATRDAGQELICPVQDAAEAMMVDGLVVRCAADLLSVCDQRFIDEPCAHDADTAPIVCGDLADVRGQEHAKRALEIAAAGRHNMLMVGPPGTGKSMLAERMRNILPPMSEAEALETASIYSITTRRVDTSGWRSRPFRAPHHTVSGVALVGGGSPPSPGEISLAHNGVLFLDELTEYDRRTLDVLREPMETGSIHISRAARQATFPSRFQLIAAMNPCPQGYRCDGRTLCECTPEQQRRHRSRISAPFLDRIDLQIEVPQISLDEMASADGPHETSAEVLARVEAARALQQDRAGCFNTDMTGSLIDLHCGLSAEGRRLLASAITKLGFSARAYHRILKLARTIADLEAAEQIDASHISEAIGYRKLDRFRRDA